MNTPMKIEEFSALLNSEQNDSELVNALSQLSQIEDPEVIVDAAAGPYTFWYGWS
jgi:negative regulator of sigma E activity